MRMRDQMKKTPKNHIRVKNLYCLLIYQQQNIYSRVNGKKPVFYSSSESKLFKRTKQKRKSFKTLRLYLHLYPFFLKKNSKGDDILDYDGNDDEYFVSSFLVFYFIPISN